MQDKYYTPTIEEFHVGFEFEMYAGTGWSNQVFPNPWWIDGAMGGYKTLENCIEGNNVRAKYLDNTDILDLKWEIDNEIEFIGYYLQKSEGIYVLRPFQGSQLVQMLENDRQIFFGIIKNKSELKRLMVQLAIHGN